MSKTWLRLMSVVVVASGLSLGLGCEKEEPTLGEQLDSAVEKTEEGVEDAAEKAGDALENAGDAVNDATK